MKDFIDFLGENPLYVILVIIGLAIAIKEVVEFYQWVKELLDKWYKNRSSRENKDKNLRKEIEQLKVYVNDDKAQIRGLELHLNEIDETNNKQNEMLEGLSESVRELRIQSIRKQILDFYPVAIDLSARPSREAYNECIRNHECYLALLALKNEVNGYIDYTYSKILDSMEQREQYKLFAENFVIQPTKDMLPKEKPIIEGFDDEKKEG